MNKILSQTLSVDSPSPIDVHVGARLKELRIMKGLSQERLGRQVGLTFQQVQKYERGTNRISASRLYELGQVLDVPPAYFFDGIAASTQSGFQESSQEAFAHKTDSSISHELQELTRAFSRIDDAQLRRSVIEMAKSLARAIQK